MENTMDWMYETSEDVMCDCFSGNIEVDGQTYSDEWDYMMNAPYTEEDRKYYERKFMDLTGNKPDEIVVDDLPF